MHITASHQTYARSVIKKKKLLTHIFFQYECEQPLSKLFLKCEIWIDRGI